jgi:lysine-N-methylase
LPSSRKFVSPHFAEKFRCIGPACEDDCCHSWDVTLDRTTFEKYHALPSGPLRSLVDATVLLRIQTPATAADPDRFYGEIRLNPDGACPFFTADRLCRIHSELGAEQLCAVCASYPRITRLIDNQPENSLQLSCPEAARQVLLDPRFMHLHRTAPGGPARYAPFTARAAALPPPDGNPHQYFWELRHFLFLVLKDRTYPLWQRVFFVGLLANRLTAISAACSAAYSSASRAAAGDTVPALLRSYSELMQQGRLRSAVDSVPARPEQQLSLILQLLERRAALGPIPRRLLECIQSFLDGVGYATALSAPMPRPNPALPGYLAANRDSFQPFLRRHPHILENYLISYIIRNRFPYGDDLAPLPGGTTPAQEHALMALRLSILQTLAIGMAGNHGKAFAPAHMVKLVQSFTKGFEHNLDVRAAMVDLIATRNLATTAGMALMLRI